MKILLFVLTLVTITIVEYVQKTANSSRSVNMGKFGVFLFILFFSISISAQNRKTVVILKNGTILRGTIKSLDPTDALTIVIGGVETHVKMDNVLSIEDINDNSITQNETINATDYQVNKRIIDVNDTLVNYKGFLLAKGNNVCVRYFNTDEDDKAEYDRKGANAIKYRLMQDGFWNVVDNSTNAHFEIDYIVNTRGSDYAYIAISSRRTGKSLTLSMKSTNESPDKNYLIGESFYNKKIKSLQKKIEKGKVPKIIQEYFTIK